MRFLDKNSFAECLHLKFGLQKAVKQKKKIDIQCLVLTNMEYRVKECNNLIILSFKT